VEIGAFCGLVIDKSASCGKNSWLSIKLPKVFEQGGWIMFAKAGAECNVETVVLQVIELGRWLTRAAAQGTAEHVVEQHLFEEALAMGHKLLGEFFKSVGPGDAGLTATLENGRTVRRLPGEPERRLVTVFGAFDIPRCVYGSRPGQKIELAPTDQRLQLPDSELSYLLQDWNQTMGVEQPFGTAAQWLKKVLGLKQSVDTLEQGNQQMARAAAAFRDAQGAPDPKAEGELLVASEDNKGVPMVRPPVIAPVGAHRKKGEKANKKQMACIGCVYSVDRQIRTPSEVIALLFRERRSDGDAPKASQKRYWAELTREVAGEVVRAQDEVFQHMRDDVKQRRRPGQVLVHLSDGQPSLEEDREKYLPRDRKTVDILDLMHVNPRLWEAAHLFHPEGSDEATKFVRERMLRVLQGKTRDVIAGLRQTGTERGLRGAKATRLRKLCKFLEKNLHRMRYHTYLRAGYPIATGVIEGACRHVIKDRMERAGMRWKIPGAQAMLELRTISANGDWEPFQNYRIEHENRRLYPHTLPLAPAA
jgi:hypothetical protein